MIELFDTPSEMAYQLVFWVTTTLFFVTGIATLFCGFKLRKITEPIAPFVWGMCFTSFYIAITSITAYFVDTAPHPHAWRLLHGFGLWLVAVLFFLIVWSHHADWGDRVKARRLWGRREAGPK